MEGIDWTALKKAMEWRVERILESLERERKFQEELQKQSSPLLIILEVNQERQKQEVLKSHLPTKVSF